MVDPGTCLAVVSIALQVTHGLLGYYELWMDADEDVVEIQRSLLWLANLFTRLDITLQKPNLQEDIVSIIRTTMKGAEDNVIKLQNLLQKLEKEGTPQGICAKFRSVNRRMVYIFHSKEIQNVKALLDELRDDLKLAISLLNLNTSATSLDDLRRVHNELGTLKATIDETSKKNDALSEGKKKEASRRLISHWLAPCSITTFHSSAYEKHETGTGRWFLNGSEFAQWRSLENQYLWLVGDVGCGKTVLCASIIEELRGIKNRETHNVDNIVYFYFTFDDVHRQDLSAFLKSALSQLCCNDSVLALVESMYDEYSPDPPSIRVLQSTMMMVLCSLCAAQKPLSSTKYGAEELKIERTYIIIDGLDEVPYGPQRTAILRHLSDISRRQYPRLNLLVSSRREWDIETTLIKSPQWKSFQVSQANVEEDLNIYINNQIMLSPRLQMQPDKIKDDIRNKLVWGASGMFRWASLQIEELKTRRILRSRDIQNVLSSLPKDLDATYERILTNIDSSLTDEAISALQWLASASRPLFLEELAEACIIQPEDALPLRKIDDLVLSTSWRSFLV